MTNLNSNASVDIDPSTPFCARTYFKGLREAGVRPYATNGRQKRYGQSCDDPAANERVRPWYLWSLEQDHGDVQIKVYVSALLAKHQPPCIEDVIVLHLGISDDEIEPQVVRVAPRPALA
jgi:hypothetical protein